jgi:uncharacterized membrane protein YoaK (UPF0700 family)
MKCFSQFFSTPSLPPQFSKWFLLSFLAGNVNAGGFLACGRFVSHVTGFATLAGVDFAFGRNQDALGMFLVPLFFVMGVVISALLMEMKLVGFRIAMGLVGMCLLLCSGGGYLSWFGVFDTTLSIKKDFLFLSLLCLSSGLQNSAVSSISGINLRTTHLTGVTTDFGMGLVRLWKAKSDATEFAREKTFSILRFGIIFSFGLGSFLGALLFLRLAYFGFFLPAFIALYVTFRPGHIRASF